MRNTIFLLLAILWFANSKAQVNCGSNLFPCSGSVGIGTNSPTYKLDVDGTIYTLRIGQSSVSYFGVQNFTNSVQLGTLDASDLSFMLNGGSIATMANSNGGRFIFGSGSVYPKSKFHVYGIEPNLTLGASTNAAIRIQNDWGDHYGELAELQFQNNSDQVNAVIASYYSSYSSASGTNQWGSHLIFGTKNSANTTVQERMRLTEDGKLGIGITSPAEYLHVNGNIRAADDGYFIAATNAHLQATSGYASIHAGGSERVRVKSDGTVMIGSFSASYDSRYKLLVDGTIGANEVYVTLTRPWPDYVFGNNYKLLSLDQLDIYIQKNKHLPNMPSADEMKKEGSINLGDMNAKLLEKLEELTLYILQLSKENEKMKSQIERLESQIK